MPSTDSHILSKSCRAVIDGVDFTTPLGITLKVLHANDPTPKPDNNNLVYWIAFSVLEGASEQADMCGDPDAVRRRTPGICLADIYAPLGKGDKKSRQIGDLIKNAFRSLTTADGVAFREPWYVPGSSSNGWWRSKVECPFYFDFFA